MLYTDSSKLKILIKFFRTKNYFLPNEIAIKYGEILVNKNYEQTLKLFRKNGSKVFYKGVIADDIISTVQKATLNPGFLSYKDLIAWVST